MEKLIGREDEKKILQEALASGEAELVAVCGRRRVGKTFLIRQAYIKQLICEFSGVHNTTVQQQLENFRNSMAIAFDSPVLPAVPKTWTEAFLLLIKYAAPLVEKSTAIHGSWRYTSLFKGDQKRRKCHSGNRPAAQPPNYLMS